ncbi:MAG: helix-turn-helix transcriptional regulator [Gemmatimonadales bacterium]|nr:helix-turn-helix transcriptional regulator [Gemmatimonadales bacterium]
MSQKVQHAFGKRLRELRSLAHPKISQDVLAETLQVSRTSISNIENGRHRVFLDQVYAAAARLGVQVHELLPPEEDIFTRPLVTIPLGARIQDIGRDNLPPLVAKALRKASISERRANNLKETS